MEAVADFMVAAVSTVGVVAVMAVVGTGKDARKFDPARRDLFPPFAFWREQPTKICKG
jgi:hypothetical protein